MTEILRLDRGRLVWVDVGRGYGEHPAIVVRVLDDGIQVVTGTSSQWLGVPSVRIDPEGRHRSLRTCLDHETWFHVTRETVKWVRFDAARITRCRVHTLVLLELDELLGRE